MLGWNVKAKYVGCLSVKYKKKHYNGVLLTCVFTLYQIF